MSVWPQLRATRWSGEQAARYYASGIWTRLGLHELLAAHPPGKPAFDDGHQTLTYGELNARVNGVATALRERGVVAGTVVALRMGNTVGHGRAARPASRLAAGQGPPARAARADRLAP